MVWQTIRGVAMSKFLFCVAVAATLLALALCICPYSPAADEKWTQKADMPTARHMLSACVVDGKIYAIGGCTPPPQNQRFATVEVYDPAADTWTRKADMPTPRLLDNAACVVNGKIYAIGGHNRDRGVLSTVEEYDPKTDTWTRKADMPTPRCHMSISTVNGKIYAIGGVNQGPDWPAISVVEEYDPATDTWTKKADMPTSRSAFDTAAVNGKIYAIGGNTGKWLVGPYLSTVEEYDPVTDIWTKKADMPIERFELAASALNGKIYVVGGRSRPQTPFDCIGIRPNDGCMEGDSRHADPERLSFQRRS